MRRYIETAFRLKIRLLLAGALVFAVAFAVLYLAKQTYSASATIWVEQPLYLTVSTNANPYISVAADQAQVLQELMSTRQFRVDIAHNVGIPLPDDAVEGQVLADLQHNLKVDALASHLVTITYTDRKPTYCAPIVNAVVQLFSAQLTADRARQAQVTLDLYKSRLDAYQQQVLKSHDALIQFIRGNPEASAPGAPPNPTLIGLQQQYDADNQRYEDMVTKIDQFTIDDTAARQLSDDTFRVIDRPTGGAPPDTGKKQLLTYAGIAFLLALCTAIALTLVSTWTEPSVHTVHDVRALPAGEDDGTAPELIVAGVPYVRALAPRRGKSLVRPRPALTAPDRTAHPSNLIAGPVPPLVDRATRVHPQPPLLDQVENYS